MTAYNTHHAKNHENARQKQPITPIIRKIVGCYSHPLLVMLENTEKRVIIFWLIFEEGCVYKDLN